MLLLLSSSRTTCYYFLIVVVLWFCYSCTSDGVASAAILVSNTTVVKEGIVRYHYEQKNEGDKFFCSTIIIIGVGTTMRVEDYDLLAFEIVAANGKQQQQQPGNIIAAIVDHAPNNPLKLSTRRYTSLVNAIASRTDDIIPVCKKNRKDTVVVDDDDDGSSSQPTTKFILGGHSASGMVAIQSLQLVEGFTPAGLIGLSPFKITNKMKPIVIPSLFWGFSRTTCGVKVGQAADQAYEISSPHRVLYQLQNPTGQPSHCIFANHGCIPICPISDDAQEQYSWIRPAVGESIHHFLQAVQSRKNFTRSSFDLRIVPEETKQRNLRMLINEDDPPKPNNDQLASRQL